MRNSTSKTPHGMNSGTKPTPKLENDDLKAELATINSIDKSQRKEGHKFLDDGSSDLQTPAPISDNGINEIDNSSMGKQGELAADQNGNHTQVVKQISIFDSGYK